MSSYKNLNIASIFLIFSSITQINCDTTALYDIYAQEATKRLFPLEFIDTTLLAPIALGALCGIIAFTGLSLFSCFSHKSSKRTDMEEEEEEVKVVETPSSKNTTETTKEGARVKKDLKMDTKTASGIIKAIVAKQTEYGP